MRRRTIQVLGLAVALCALAAGVAVASAPSRAALANPVCHRALAPAHRRISVTALMRSVPGTLRLGVNFHLLERPRGAIRYTRVRGPGLNTWITKAFGQRPGDVWRVIHPVRNLAAPATYRFAVSFRWTGAGGAVLARASRLSLPCHQPELRPDLEVKSIAVQPDPANAQQDDYTVRIHNGGVTGAGPFQVTLSDQGSAISTSVAYLAGGSSQTLQLAGPLCNAANPPVVTADPQHQVDVYSRSEATLTATCPAT